MTGAGAVTAVVLLEWTVGWVAGAAWSQSWSVIRRGHFRITAWGTLALGTLALIAERVALEGVDGAGWAQVLTAATVVAAALYLVTQYRGADAVPAIAGAISGALGAGALVAAGAHLAGWSWWFAGLQLLVGALLLGAVTNGMMLGHWYLNQPGLKPWALARLTGLALAGTAAAALVGLVAAPRLANASTEGAALGLPGFGDSFGVLFYAIWGALVVFTGAVVWMARRCIALRSIQSATGLYYVAILTAGVAEFLVRYLMVNAS